MKLSTFGLSWEIESVGRKYQFLWDLDKGILKNDLYWHFALHPKGMTLRCSPNKTEKLIKELKKKKIKYKKDKHYYIPSINEYYGVHTLSDEMILILHALSLTLIRHLPSKSRYITLERLNHMFINMSGVHDFYQEAQLYLELAEGRLSLIGRNLPVPKWFYKIYLFFKYKPLTWIKYKFS